MREATSVEIVNWLDPQIGWVERTFTSVENRQNVCGSWVELKSVRNGDLVVGRGIFETYWCLSNAEEKPADNKTSVAFDKSRATYV